MNDEHRTSNSRLSVLRQRFDDPSKQFGRAHAEALFNIISDLTERLEISQEACAKVVKERNELRDAAYSAELKRLAHEPSATLPPKLDTTMPSVWHFLLVAAHEVVEAVDFNHAHKDSPLKWTVPWAKVTALRAAVLRAKELNGAGLPEPPSDRHRLELRLAFDKWMATRDPQALSEIAMLINAVCGATVTKSAIGRSLE